ncbi:MAG: NAD(P)/FAD-dependent oxidoreductase [Gemmatimonadota bacterium]|nr:NAD(P)/FAD-dependent oxidoreductase [Gemmatimonadota bacterium]
MPRIVIIGGGFAGLRAARELRNAPVRITLIDRRNHHLFQPLLYQVATAALSPADIAAPIRNVLRGQRNTDVLLAEVDDFDVSERRVIFDNGNVIDYDFLIVASGATHHYFGHDDWERLAPGLKTAEDAIVIRRRFLLAFEAAEQEPDPAVRRALLTFVVVGAGPTGVELAGSMAEVARHAMVRDFRHIDPTTARVVLLEAGPRVLSSYAEDLSRRAEGALRRLGVEVRTGSAVTAMEADGVCIGDERIAARNVVWAAGVRASRLGRKLGGPTDPAGRVCVAADLSLPDHPEVFVIGDLAALETAGGKPVPGIAPAAMQQGSHAARNIRLLLAGRRTEPFHYTDKGNLATIGRRAAVFERGRIRLFGFTAWVLWLFVHIFYLIGFRNRVVVFIHWAWSYVTWQRGARLITGEIGTDLAPPERALGERTGDQEPLREARKG